MTKDDAVAKVKKLLALSKSSNEHEAALALKRAMDLMSQFDLDDKTIHYTEAAPESLSRRRSPWRDKLTNAVAWLNGVVPAKGYFCYMFLGPELEAEVACEMYDYLEKAILRITRSTVRKNAKHKYRESFRLGMAVNLSNRIHEMADTYGWVGDRKERITAIQEAFSKDLTEYKPKKQRKPNSTAFGKGYAAGNDVGLARQVNGGREQAVIGG